MGIEKYRLFMVIDEEADEWVYNAFQTIEQVREELNAPKEADFSDLVGIAERLGYLLEEG